jgi:hypothetical protein
MNTLKKLPGQKPSAPRQVSPSMPAGSGLRKSIPVPKRSGMAVPKKVMPANRIGGTTRSTSRVKPVVKGRSNASALGKSPDFGKQRLAIKDALMRRMPKY